MNQQYHTRMKAIAALGVSALAGMVPGCAQKPAETPATIKADMGGNYPPSVKAQQQAYQQQEQQRARQFIDSHGTAQPQRSSTASGRP